MMEKPGREYGNIQMRGMINRILCEEANSANGPDKLNYTREVVESQQAFDYISMREVVWRDCIPIYRGKHCVELKIPKTRSWADTSSHARITKVSTIS